MTRKVFLTASCILLALVCFGIFAAPRLFGVVFFSRGSASEVEELLSSHTEAEAAFFTELAFSGETLPYDKNTSTFYLPLSMETDTWEFGELDSADPEVELIFEEDFTDSKKLDAIADGTSFRFYAVKGEEYQVCYLVATGLPVIAIESEADADAGEFTGTVYFWDNSTKVDWKSSSILEGRVRGNTSRTYEKKGYRLTLLKQDRDGELVEDQKSLFGLRTDDEWILNAMYSDSSKIRDSLSAEVWAGIGAEQSEYQEAYFGTETAYVELFFNNEYWGLYVLMEPVDSKQLDLDDDEYSYKSASVSSLTTEELLATEDFTSELDGYEVKGGRTGGDASDWEALFNYLELRDLSDDETFSETASEIADTESALDFWIYLQAVLGIDNRGKNVYYVAKRSGNSLKIYFAPWDMDITWGDALSAGTGDRVWTVDLLTDLYSERINWSFGDRLIELDVDGARDYVSERWSELRSGVLSDENLTEMIDSLVSEVRDSGALTRDADRWPDSDSGQDYEQFKRLSLYRMSILDYYFEGRMDEYMGLGYQ